MNAGMIAGRVDDLGTPHVEQVRALRRQSGTEPPRPVAAVLVGTVLGRATALANVPLMSRSYTAALYKDDNATLDNLREAVTMLEEIAQIARRVLGSAHPLVDNVEWHMRNARAALRARETPSPPGSA